MVLINLTKGKVLTEKVEFADTFLKRAVGLMFRGSYDGALIFPLRGKTLFHGFFCFFPILLICVKGRKVVCMKVLKPWSLTEVEGDYVIEMDARRDVPVDVGDEVEVREVSNEGRGPGNSAPGMPP